MCEVCLHTSHGPSVVKCILCTRLCRLSHVRDAQSTCCQLGLKETEGKRIIMIIDSFVERTSGGLDDTAPCALHKGVWWGGGGYMEPYTVLAQK